MAPDQVELLLIQDNIELACHTIEKAVMYRAIASIDGNFAASYEFRRRHRQVMATSISYLAFNLILAPPDKSWSAFLGCIHL